MATSDINSVIIVGRLTRDAELKYLNSGTAVASVSIAVNRSKKEGDQWTSEAHFFDVEYFGKGAEGVKPYLTKGTQIAVQGSLRQDRWEKDGQNHSRVKIIADSVELLGSKNSTNSNTTTSPVYQQRPSYQSNQSEGGGYNPSSESLGSDSSGFPEDIPF